MSEKIREQYEAFARWCCDNPQRSLDPRLHQHAGPIERGGYIADPKTASAFAAWRAALAQQPAPAAPAGWKLVPIEPTPEMLAATSWPGCAGADYAKMIAAAPAAPVVQTPLEKRCRELELWQADAREHMAIIERENDEMREELQRLQSVVLQAATASAELAKYLRAEQTLDELATACKDLAPWKNILAAQGAGKKPRAKK